MLSNGPIVQEQMKAGSYLKTDWQEMDFKANTSKLQGGDQITYQLT